MAKGSPHFCRMYASLSLHVLEVSSLPKAASVKLDINVQFMNSDAGKGGGPI